MGDSTGFGHTSRVTPASRNRTLAWAVLAGVLFAVLAYLVSQDRAPLDSFDVEGRALEDWADDYAGLVHVLRVIEVAFGTIGMTILTVLLAGGLFLRRQRWASLVVVVVMIGDLARDDRAQEVARARPSGLAGHPRPAQQLQLPVGPRLVRGGVLLPADHAARALRAPRQPPAARHHARRGVVARRLRRPDDARTPLPDRRHRRHAAGALRLPRDDRRRRPAPPLDRRQGRAAAGGLHQRASPRGDPQPDQGRGRRPVPRRRRRDGQGVGLVRADLAVHDGRGPRHRHGREGGRLRRRPRDRLRRRRHRA